MTSHENLSEQQQLPISDVRDVLMISRSVFDAPEDAVGFAGLQVSEIAQGFVAGNPVNEDTLQEFSYWLGLEYMLNDGLAGTDSADTYMMEKQPGFLAAISVDCAERGVTVDFGSAMAVANRMSTAEVWDHFLTELEGYRGHLTGEQPLPVDEQSGEPAGLKDPGHYVDIAEALWVSAIVGDFDAGRVADNAVSIAALSDRLEPEIAQLANAFLSADKVGVAIKFGSLLSNSELAEPFADAVVSRLQAIGSGVDSRHYRSLYNYAAQTFRREQLAHFLSVLPKEPTPRIFGSKSELHFAGTDNPILGECFEEGDIVWTTLSDGTKIPLPSIDYRTRTIMGYGTSQEDEHYGRQTGVEYDELSEDAQAALETAIRVADGSLLRTETLPYYRRLALWPEGNEDRLYTVIFRDGAGRLMNRYPDHHGFVTSDTERKLDLPVKSARIVRDTYMAVPYDGSHLQLQTFRDAEANFFGPGEEQANAFWIMGNPRVVNSDTDSRLCIGEGAESTPRFLILPIRYFWIETDRDMPDPASEDR